MKKILPRRFRRCVRILAAMTLFSLAAVQQAGAERFLFIPLDNRPVTRDYTVDTFHLAGHEIITPPETLLASNQSRGDAAALENFLDQEARGLDGAVVSLDSLIYGGLVTSRTHEFSDKELEERLGPVLHFKENHPGVPLYGFVTVMRSPKYSSAPHDPEGTEAAGSAGKGNPRCGPKGPAGTAEKEPGCHFGSGRRGQSRPS